MKQFILQSVKGFLFFCLVFSFTSVHAERKIRYSPLASSDYLLSVQNLTQTAPNKLEFDIYLLDTDPTEPFILNLISFGFLFNSGIYSGGVATVAMDNTNSQLNPFQALYVDPILETNTKYPNQTLLSLASFDPVSIANRRTTISTTGYGTLITHLIITNSVPFVDKSTPDIVFCSSAVFSPYYPTIVTQWIAPLSTILVTTPGVDAIVNGNPTLDFLFTKNSNIKNTNIELFPNPTDENLLINGLEGKAVLKLVDINGQEIVCKQISNNALISISSLPKGIYIVRIISQNEIIEKKIIKK